jgi:hypothetical protein
MNNSSEWNSLPAADGQASTSDNQAADRVTVRTKAVSKPIIVRSPVTVRLSADRAGIDVVINQEAL